ncbi:YlbE family protein [Rubrivivax gelatinosus]|uniref:DUF1116 domain-containing protein n=1 Tax=Rubrivivax gelatinosus (strain NBRC 100245 / IL144) TaxID=983917 RepID=I0HMJ5_RUBGI|nr:DUF1116 domain-containing protein [Rubrivivax gelatinosus]BAL94232.1 hypothetical protein RGE_08910 [Rubrivivax gelatinosus IL144]
MYETINEANEAVLNEIKRARPRLVDVRPAADCIPVLREGRTLLHAGPPSAWADMTGPMQGAVLGAAMFEGWARDAEEAERLAASGEIRFTPCHDHSAVGPMGGITSASMPVLVVLNEVQGNTAFCNLNEGIGKVMRFGAFEGEVQTRLAWMRDVLGPVLSQALGMVPGGIDLSVLMAQAITMGDEFHQRNIAASALLLKLLAPDIAACEASTQHKEEVLRFLGRTDQFFLNVAMAYCKCVMDAGAAIEAGSIVTAMTRNGRDFGIRVSGTGKRWFTAPVNTPAGLFFTGFSQDDANPDIGDSAITETLGIGGAAMIAAPGVTRFVGAGGFSDALETSEEMREIYVDSSPMFQIPTWDFQAACLGLDVRRVVETGITPVINTGIAHRKAGIGQVGAGTVRPPRGCFEKALEAVAETVGVAVD